MADGKIDLVGVESQTVGEGERSRRYMRFSFGKCNTGRTGVKTGATRTVFSCSAALEMGRTGRFSGKTGADIRGLTGIKNQTWGLDMQETYMEGQIITDKN